MNNFVYLVDDENYSSAKLGKDDFTAAAAWENVMSFDEEVYAPGDTETWWLLISNTVNPQSIMTMDLAYDAVGVPEDVDDTGDDDDDEECSCGL